MAYTDPLDRAILPKMMQLRIDFAKKLKLIIEDKKTYAESDGRDAVIKILQSVLNGRYNENIEALQKDMIKMYGYADIEYDLRSDFNAARNYIQLMQSPTRCLMRELIRRMGLYHYSDIKDRNLKAALTRLINNTKKVLMSCETTKEGIDAMFRLIDGFKKIQGSIDQKDYSYHIYYKSIIENLITVSENALKVIGYDETTYAPQQPINESVSRPSNGSMPYDEYMDSQRGPMVPAAKEKIVQDRLTKYFNKFLELKNGYLRNYDIERVSRWYGADATNQALPIVKKELQPVYDIVRSTKFIREMRLLSGGDGMYLANHYNDIFVDMQEKAGQVEDKFRELKDIWEERQSNAMNENDTNLYNLYGAVYNLISRKYEDTSKLFESVYEYCSTALNLLNIKLG